MHQRSGNNPKRLAAYLSKSSKVTKKKQPAFGRDGEPLDEMRTLRNDNMLLKSKLETMTKRLDEETGARLQAQGDGDGYLQYIGKCAKALSTNPPQTPAQAMHLATRILIPISDESSAFKNDVLDTIKQLASFAGCERIACDSLLEYADVYKHYIIERRKVAASGVQFYCSVMTETQYFELDKLLHSMLSANWMRITYPPQSTTWAAVRIVGRISTLIDEMSNELKEPVKLFPECLKLMRIIKNRQYAVMMGNKLAAECQPALAAELVEMVKDAICSEEDIKALLA